MNVEHNFNKSNNIRLEVATALWQYNNLQGL